MRKKWWNLIWILAAFMACSSPKALEYKDYHNLKIDKLGFNNSSIKLDLEYYNPNSYGLQLKKTDVDIFINGNLLGHSTTDTLINIKRNSAFTVPITFEVNMQNAFKNAFNTLTGKEILIRLTGKIKVGKGNVFMSFPVEFETKQAFSFW